MKYGTGVIKWKKDELQNIDRSTRKFLTMRKIFNPNSDVDRLYFAKEERRKRTHRV